MEEIKKQRELLKNEIAEIGQCRFDLTKLIIEKEEATSRYYGALGELDKRIDKFYFIEESLEK